MTWAVAVALFLGILLTTSCLVFAYAASEAASAFSKAARLHVYSERRRMKLQDEAAAIIEKMGEDNAATRREFATMFEKMFADAPKKPGPPIN